MTFGDSAIWRYIAISHLSPRDVNPPAGGLPSIGPSSFSSWYDFDVCIGCSPIVAHTLLYCSASATADFEVSNCVPTTFITTPASFARMIVSSRSPSYATKFTWQCASKYFIPLEIARPVGPSGALARARFLTGFISILFFAREQILWFFVCEYRFFYLRIRLGYERIEHADDFVELGGKFGNKLPALFWICFHDFE